MAYSSLLYPFLKWAMLKKNNFYIGLGSLENKIKREALSFPRTTYSTSVWNWGRQNQ